MNYELTAEEEARNRYLLEILHLFADACDRAGIRWYGAYGTVLGAVRHQGFIPWDDDVDVMVSVDDYPRMLAAVRAGLAGTPYSLGSHLWDKDFDMLFSRIGRGDGPPLHFDIWPLAGAPKSAMGRRIFTGATYATRTCFYIKKLSVD